LRVRQDSQGNKYGEDSLDPMLWQQSSHLLAPPSYGLALRVLDEFLQTHAETLIQYPLKRAMLQSDLWAVFDWSVQEYSRATEQSVGYGNEKRQLQTRLAEVDLPSFPAGTQVALVRQMMLFDNQGNLVVSLVTQSVQIRVYREITTAPARDFSDGPAATARNSGQDFFEIRISRPLLFQGKQGGLRATARDETEPPTFQTHGDDPIDESPRPGRADRSFSPITQTCLGCHSRGGISSFNSLDSLLKPTRRQQEPQDANYGPRYWSDVNAVWWKENRYDWGLLNGYWQASTGHRLD
jgi:hypothetical protein